MAHPASHLVQPDVHVHHPDRWPGCGTCLETVVAEQGKSVAERRADMLAAAAMERLILAYPDHAHYMKRVPRNRYAGSRAR